MSHKSYEELETELADTMAALEAIRAGDVDTIIATTSNRPHLRIEQLHLVEERDRLLEQLRRKNVELIRTTGELQAAKEQAESSTKLKDKFVSLVAHDLKNPFAAIIGLVRAVLSEDSSALSDQGRRTLERALESGGRMLRLIDELLQVSRFQTGSIELKKTFFSGSGSSALAINTLSEAIRKKKVTVVNEVSDDIRLYADQTLFQEVIQNILSNAIKFSPEKERIRIYSPNGKSIAIWNGGPGVDDMIGPDLFSYEVKTTFPGTAGEQGYGLGLPLSYDIMKAHCGDLCFENQQGDGVVFKATLPEIRPVALYVSGSPEGRDDIRAMVESLEVDVVMTENGGDVIKRIKTNPPHLLLLSLGVKDIDPFEVIKTIKENPAWSSLPIIVLTEHGAIKQREQVFRLGADDFVTTPLVEEEFIPRIRRFFV